MLLQVSQEVSYQIFATSATFFVPLILILILYWRIFLAARYFIYNFIKQSQPWNSQIEKMTESNKPFFTCCVCVCKLYIFVKGSIMIVIAKILFNLLIMMKYSCRDLLQYFWALAAVGFMFHIMEKQKLEL